MLGMCALHHSDVSVATSRLPEWTQIMKLKLLQIAITLAAGWGVAQATEYGHVISSHRWLFRHRSAFLSSNALTNLPSCNSAPAGMVRFWVPWSAGLSDTTWAMALVVRRPLVWAWWLVASWATVLKPPARRWSKFHCGLARIRRAMKPALWGATSFMNTADNATAHDWHKTPVPKSP